MGDREALKAAMARWEQMDANYRSTVARQHAALDRLAQANMVMGGALQQIANTKMAGGMATVAAQKAIDDAQAILAVPQEEENKGE